MFIIESRDNSRLWISGIFMEHEDLETNLCELKANNIACHKVVCCDIKKYPMFIIERFGSSYQYFDKETLSGFLFDFIHQNEICEEDDPYFILYIIHEDYIPKMGTDGMGLLTHYHVDRDFLMNVISHGVKAYSKKH